MSNFADAITYLAADDDPRQRISAIKTAVVKNLKSTDARVRVDVTDHFNHSYVPDLVLSWPDSTERRNVFLRTSYRARDLLQDVDLLSSSRPILMPLAPIEQYDEALNVRSSQHCTLITDPYGLETFDAETHSAPVVSLLSHAVLQGGRGVISSNRAHSISEAVGAGFIAAQQADYETTSIAVQATEATLDSYRASQLNRLLHAVWVGSGASSARFPGASGITATLDTETLRFILELPDLDDAAFWSTLGHGLTTERICQLADFPPNTNLQRLIAGCVNRLQSKACRVVAVSSGVDSWLWEITAGTLTLRTPSHRIHFAPRHIRDLPESNMPVRLVTVAAVRSRAERASVSVSEVKLSNGDSTITYGAEERIDVVSDDALVAVEDAVTDAKVISAVARISQTGERSVRCNLAAATGSGNSSAMYSVAELASIAAPLLADIPPGELQAIHEAVSGPGSPENRD